MKYTDLNYYMDTLLVKKLDLMIKRMSDNQRKDNLLLVEGSEGDGKSNVSVGVAYYVSQQTGRDFSEENIYFDVEKMVQDAKSSEKKIFIWDEPALSGLTVEWWNKAQINLVKLLMIARKKRHFFIFNFTKFYKFNEYIVVDRAIGMIHVYSRYLKDGSVQQGRFCYFKQESLRQLYYYYRSTKRRAYKKYKNFYGSFPWVLPKIINEEKYEQKKDEAIMGLGDDKKDRKNIKLHALKYKVGVILLQFPKAMEMIEEKFEIKEHSLLNWRKRYREAYENEQNA